MNWKNRAAFLLPSTLWLAGTAVGQESAPPAPKREPAFVVRGVDIPGIDRTHGSRRGGRGRLSITSAATATAIADGLKWLAAHQDPSGRWGAAGFAEHDTPRLEHPGLGAEDADVLVSSLALLALLADGSTMRSGPYKDGVKRAVVWLRNRQRPSGAFSDETAPNFVASQAVATWAMGEAYVLSQYKTLRKNAVKGLACLDRFRLPGGGWTSDPKFDGKAGAIDPSLAFWCAMAYGTLAMSDPIPAEASLPRWRPWFATLVDKKNGIVPCPIDRGPLGSSALKITPAVLDAERVAAILSSQLLTGGEAPLHAGGRRAIESVGTRTPVWKKGEMSHYGWFCASHVLHQVSDQPGSRWTRWSAAMRKTVVAHQRQDGSSQGSWDPDGVWGPVGGRVYTTALLTMALSASHQFSRRDR